ncbi:hypothetical protein [Pseudomonas juntendi]|jgi:hypothetical protein|uniref:hypothetical protein n=1 Tax=Pseudomonas TaxID=286 RepID=UPI001F251863|nr:hypothetical protein [Pseudomonas juntendi]MCO7058326.1 hypothetical protein [Pseudomonas juntendi]UJM15216.1 hypothetical protein L1P09_26145 [Pseudomonas juntendi]
MFQMPASFDTVAHADQGAALEVEGPNGVVDRDEHGRAKMIIFLQGSDSQAYRTAQNINLNKRLAKRNVKMTAEELEAETINMLAGVTVRWEGFLGLDGQPIACTRQSATALYTKYPFIRDQADRFINERANFLPSAEAQSSNSPSTSSGSVTA